MTKEVKEKEMIECPNCGGGDEEECSCCGGSGVEDCGNCLGTGEVEKEED